MKVILKIYFDKNIIILNISNENNNTSYFTKDKITDAKVQMFWDAIRKNKLYCENTKVI